MHSIIRGFLLTGPASVTPGGDEIYCATFHHVKGTARGILDLTWSDGISSSVELYWENGLYIKNNIVSKRARTFVFIIIKIYNLFFQPLYDKKK